MTAVCGWVGFLPRAITQYQYPRHLRETMELATYEAIGDSLRDVNAVCGGGNFGNKNILWIIMVIIFEEGLTVSFFKQSEHRRTKLILLTCLAAPLNGASTLTQALKLLSVGAWSASLKVSWNPIVLVPPWRLTAKPEEDPVTGAAAWTLVYGNGSGRGMVRVRVEVMC